jgi:hypothetical protein
MVSISAAGWLLMAAQAEEWKASVLQTINRVIGKIGALGLAFAALPWLDPGQKALAQAALDGIGTLMAGIANETGAARDRAEELRAAAEAIVTPLADTSTRLVEMRGAWVTVGAAAEEAATKTVELFDSAGNRISGSLSGGFGQGMEEGVKTAKVMYNDFQQWVENNPVRPRIDTEYMQRQLAEGIGKPDTGGSLLTGGNL